jgi:hypothetical protein
VGEVYVRFALANPHRYRLMFGEKMQGSPHPEVHEAAHALYEGFVGAVAECQEAGELPAGDPAGLAALIYATVHGAVDLALAGQEGGTRASKTLCPSSTCSSSTSEPGRATSSVHGVGDGCPQAVYGGVYRQDSSTRSARFFAIMWHACSARWEGI